MTTMMDTIAPTFAQTGMDPLFETLMSCVSDGILVTDEDGGILCLNNAFRELLDGSGPGAADEAAALRRLGLDRFLAMAGRATCPATATAAHPHGSPLERFIRVKERVRSGGATRDMEFLCGTIGLPDGGRSLKVVISQDRGRDGGLPIQPDPDGPGFITNDREMVSILSRLEQIAQSTAPVLLMGESGTGKTQIARMIHAYGPRAHKPLVELNCAAIPEQLLESELFGHVKGAFTGATQNRKGRFQAANGGVLLLDEIGEFPLHLQAKLLRAIQDQRFEPVGSDETVEVDVRVISATNQNLRNMVNDGRFRADLFYRIAVVPMKIPPLRERVGDIPLLLKHFCTNLQARGYPDDVTCTPEAMRMMMDYPWPGNVREMLNAVEHAYICAIDKAVLPESLPQDIRHFAMGARFKGMRPLTRFAHAHPVQAQGGEDADIRRALELAGGNKSEAAKALGIDRTTLWRRMRKLGMTV
ncbi:MAG: sigma 54-interacting transcriptional regulator [Alphaproteobacteria bacterium]|nr:sigma 54-interacting transcriptional regulator [Alphaproteobacteria bacterium]